MSGRPAFAPLILCFLLLPHAARGQLSYVEQRTAKGTLRGVVSADGKVRTFKGIPYAAPPVGPLRWKPPQPVAAWTGVRQATGYGARCMQARVYADMIFHDDGPSEDCLYLNLWMPASATAGARLPVMVWIYGGGFAAGATSEPRQDGGNLSKQGVVVVSMNYRLGIFGFFSHPELARESAHHASGNYGLMDQVAALRWVRENIAAFGGDPQNVTIFGESAGSFSVSALMASPLAKGLFRRAIGESGAFFGDTLRLKAREETEKADAQLARTELGSDSLAALRVKPADQILQALSKSPPIRFVPNIDGYFLPQSVEAIFAAGRQSHVPLLAGWNADEQNARAVLEGDDPTPASLAAHARQLYGARAEEILKVYPAATPAQAARAAGDLASDRFIGFGTWKWLEAQLKTGQSPVYRYRFEQALPLAEDAEAGAEPSTPHASEIEFVFQVLSSRDLPWRVEDRKVAALMGRYWTNFAKTGDPNGEGLPRWPVYGTEGYPVMRLSAEPYAAADARRARYLLLDSIR
jgi:para-nitrobenzyl esterase